MSGPRPRRKIIGVPKEALCHDCDLSPGWGWEQDPKEKAWRTEDGGLPPAGNGWTQVGLCKRCNGTGIPPCSGEELL
jgi:hypothetical protein